MSEFIQKLRNLFNKSSLQQELPSDIAQTKPLPDEKTLPLPEYFVKEEVSVEPPQLIAGCSQSTGIQRERNEDAMYTLTTTLVSDTRYINFGLYIIADGMGGHEHGEVASAIAVRTMAEHVFQNCYTPLFSQTPSPPEKSLQEHNEASARWRDHLDFCINLWRSTYNCSRRGQPCIFHQIRRTHGSTDSRPYTG